MAKSKAGPQFPRELEAVREKLERAATSHEDPVVWPEGEKIRHARGAETIGSLVIPQFHTHLRNMRIAYLFQEKMGGAGDKITWGQASKAPAKMKLLADVDFLITFNFTQWHDLTLEQKIALVDHELEHCGLNDDGLPTMLPHDVEEFSCIVRRWGLWKLDLKQFGFAMKDALQGDLFAAAPEPVKPPAPKPAPALADEPEKA